MNASIVSVTASNRYWRASVLARHRQACSPLADAGDRLNTPELQTPEPVAVGERGRELVAEGVDAVLRE
jgi:hypothetical protein